MLTGVIVIPCYNEAERLNPDAFRRFVQETSGVRLLMVNDGSTDATLSLLRELESSEPSRIGVHDMPCNSGKAEAVRQGTLVALAEKPDFVGFLDADLATPLAAISQFREVLERRPDIHIVIGTRISLLGRQLNRKRLRSILGRVFGMVASRTIGLRIYDTQCGAKVFRADTETAAMFQHPFQSRWIFDVELLARMIVGRKATNAPPVENVIYELPLDFWEDVAGSKLQSKDFLQAVFELAAIYWRYFMQSDSRREVEPIGDQLSTPASDLRAELDAVADDESTSDNQKQAA